MRTHLETKEQYIVKDGGVLYKVENGKTGKILQLVVPNRYRGELLEYYHYRQGHVSAAVMEAQMELKYTWETMKADIEATCYWCDGCQRFKDGRSSSETHTGYM